MATPSTAASCDSAAAPASGRAPLRGPRTRAHLFFLLVTWPLLTALGAAVALTWIPYYAVSLPQALAAALAGVALSYGDLLTAGALCFGFSWWIFGQWGRPAADAGRARLWLEPPTTLLAIAAGTAVWYPALLAQPLFYPLSGAPVWLIVAVLAAAVTFAASKLGRRGRRAALAAMLLVAGVLSPLPLHLRAHLAAAGRPSSLVILGIDSVSRADDVGRLEGWIEARGGTWYERAVAPGLLTNAVWSSIVAERPVSAHTIFHTFQHLPRTQAGLLEAAREAGYRTVSVFPDQLTCAVGSRAGFDVDRSGPVGWRQMLLPLVANGSLLVPLVRPVLPEAWPSPIRSNQSATYTYDVRRDVRGILRAGVAGQPSLVAAHLTYTHSPSYPSTMQLTWDEIRRVAAAPAMLVQDHSLDWQHVDGPEDPLPLRQWKLEHLFETLAAEVESADFLEAGSRLVVFSDHGQRFALTPHNFQDPQYHHVVLATLGLPARCPEAPISLIDIGRLAGLQTARAAPAVEFAIAQSDIWPRLVNSARLRWSGDVDLDTGLLGQLFGELRRHTPWPADGGACDLTADASLSGERTTGSADPPAGISRR